jgi:hypothetical protein
LQKIVRQLADQLQHESAEKDKLRSLLRELLEALRGRKSEQLSREQLALFEAAWKAEHPEDESAEEEEEQAENASAPEPREPQVRKAGGRQPLARNVVPERVGPLRLSRRKTYVAWREV